MAKEKSSPKRAVSKLRQIDVLMGGGRTLAQACKESGITDVIYYRWRRNGAGP